MNEFNSVVLIQLARIYDVMLAMYTTMSPEQGQQLAKMHENGEFLGALPAILLDNDVTDE